MKKNICITAAILLFGTVITAQPGLFIAGKTTNTFYKPSNNFSQNIYQYLEDTIVQNKKKLYLEKSRSQRSSAWFLLGAGSALISGGLLVGNRNNSSFNEAAIGFIMGTAGVAAGIGSIPLFISARKNKAKAALTIGIQKTTPLVKKQMPAMSLSISLR